MNASATPVTAELVNAFQRSGRLQPVFCTHCGSVITAVTDHDQVWLDCRECGHRSAMTDLVADVVTRTMALPDTSFVKDDNDAAHP